jgi:type II secretory pathway pseudopilin PulG
MSEKKSGTPKRQNNSAKRIIGVILFVIVIVAVVAGALMYSQNQAGGTSITVFENNFNSAARVAIVVYAKNNTGLGPPIDCAANLIEQLTGTKGAAHRDPTTINYYVLNSTSCSSYPEGFGGASSNTTPATCLFQARQFPRIFINYSTTNSTIITPDALYESGDVRFMIQCGIAAELTSG